MTRTHTLRAARAPLLVVLLLAALVPAASAQDLAVGEGRTYVALPHAVTLQAGEENTVEVRIVAAAACTDGHEAPPPLELVLTSGRQGPDDGDGPAWRFLETSWSLNWTQQQDGNHTIEETLAVPVEANGYGRTGASGEFAIAARSISDDGACSPDGITIPASSEHAHVTVGAGAKDAGEDAPGAAVGLLLAGLVAVAWVRRR